LDYFLISDLELIGDPRQVIHARLPLFTKQYRLVPVNSGDAVKLGR